MAAAIFPQPGPEAEAEAARTWCANVPGPARNASVRGSRPRAAPGSGRAAAMGSAAVESFVTKQLDLLELERDAEVEERRYRRRPVLSPSVRPFPQPCSAHIWAGPLAAFCLTGLGGIHSPDRLSSERASGGGSAASMEGNLVTSRAFPGHAAPGLAP